MADFNFLRVLPVDLKRYLPQFLEQDPTFAETMESLSKEHEKQRLALMDITKQFFVTTATWGLDDWEDFLGITTDTNKTADARRQAIIQKINGNNVVTLEFLTRLVNMYVADGQAFIIDHPETYNIDILYHGGQVLDYKALETAVHTYIPAHLGFKLITYTTGTLIHHGAGTAQTYTKTAIDMINGYAINVKDMAQYTAGAVVHHYKKTSIGGQ